jgi:hypothetical protein
MLPVSVSLYMYLTRKNHEPCIDLHETWSDTLKKKNKLRRLSPQANYTYRATAVCWRS